MIPIDPIITSALLGHAPDSMLRTWLLDRVNLDSECLLITAIRIMDHWVPIVWHLCMHQVHTSSCDVTDNTSQYVQQATNVLTRATGFSAGHSNHRVARPWCDGRQDACGAQAIAWIQCAIGPTPEPGHLTHSSFRHRFTCSLVGRDQVHQVHYLAGGKFSALKAGLAQCLIDSGHPIRQIGKLVDALHEKIPQGDIQTILDTPKSKARSLAISQKLSEHDITGGTRMPNPSKGKFKGKGKGKGRRNQSIDSPDITELTLHPGFFQDDKGNSLPILIELSAKLRPWWQAGLQAPDELAAVTLASPTKWPKFPSHAVTCPATCTSGGRLVLRATLTQLGSKPVKWEKSFKVVDDSVVTCHITALQSNLARVDDAWSTIQQAPAKAILARLTQTAIRDSARSVWGRSFRNSKGACKVQDATSIRIWLHISETSYEALFRESGFSRLNISPHDSIGLPHHDLSMIWVRETREEVESRLQSLPHLGYITTDRGIGVRCKKQHFEKMWQTLRPNEECQPQIAIAHLYKLLALPAAITADGLKKFAEQAKWTMRPIKKLSPAAWLVGAAEPYASDFVFTVLIQPVESKGARHSNHVIVASAGLKQGTASCSGSSASGDPWMVGPDPWSKAHPQPVRTAVAPLLSTCKIRIKESRNLKNRSSA